MRRFFEILPAALAWLTLALMIFLSAKAPTAVAVFIILFDIYWLLKTIYLSFHLRSTFRAMRENLKINWLERLRTMTDDYNDDNSASSHRQKPLPWSDVYQLVIFPMYREPSGVVRESFASLLRANYPKEKFIVVLATEESAGEEARATAKKIEQEFGHLFFKFLVTEHPVGLAGEIPGKGSNEAWAAKGVQEKLIDPLRILYEHILVSVFDVDTQVPPEYFGRLTYAFLHAPNRLRAVYQPIPLFTNNVFEAPPLARIVSFSATFWQMMQQARPERLTTFSSQSIPFPVLRDIGFWQTDVVSEDSRIFWQGFLRYHGDFRVVPLLYPVYMDANVAPTFSGTMKNIYRQQRRWGWGVENIPYMLEGFRNDPQIPRGKKWYWTWSVLEGFHSWATNALMIFALGWLPVLVGGESFNATLLSYNLPHITRFVIELSMIGIATSAALSVMLLPPRPAWFRARHTVLYALEWLLMPLTLILFGAFPGLEAQTRLMIGGRARLGFWVTPKMRK